MGTRCEVHLLGAFVVAVDGKTLPVSAWRHDGSADLVALLALEPTHRLNDEEIARRLWPDLSSPEARHRLGRAVKGARKATKDKRAVTTEGDFLRLWPHGELSVDVHAFTATAKHARTPEQRTAALAIYTGDLLPQRGDAGWTDAVRTRARLMRLELLRDPDSATPAWIDLRDPSGANA